MAKALLGCDKASVVSTKNYVLRKTVAASVHCFQIGVFRQVPPQISTSILCHCQLHVLSNGGFFLLHFKNHHSLPFLYQLLVSYLKAMEHVDPLYDQLIH